MHARAIEYQRLSLNNTVPGRASLARKTGLYGLLVKARLRFEDDKLEELFQRHYAARVYVVVQGSILLAIVTYALFGLADMTSSSGGVQSTRFRFMVATPLLGALFGLSFLRFVRRHWYVWSVIFAASGTLCVFVTALLLDAETEFRLSTGAASLNFLLVMAFVALLPLTTIGTLTVGAFVQAVHALLISKFAAFSLNISLYFAGHLAGTFVVVLCVAYWRERLLRQAFADGVRTREEKEAFKAHLLAFTSMDALRRTQDDQRSLADVFGEATVMFCDIVDFTSLTERIAPRHLVEVLSTVFLTLDALAAKHGVEKVKTIGDAYMAIAVAAEGKHDAAETMADFALAVMQASEPLSQDTGCPIRFRIGLHTGSVVGGVVGRQKMTYDYWGRTVNIASRLETTGEPGRVQVSEATYLRLKRAFRLEKRAGAVDLKGIGPSDAYFLVDRLAGAAPLHRPLEHTLALASL